MEIQNLSSSFLLLLPFLSLVSGSSDHELGHQIESIGGRRVLLNFKDNPHGNNRTFDCSPTGHCVPCQHSEKNDGNYRCSETGYRMRFHCLEMKGSEEKESEEGRRTSEVSQYTEKAVIVVHDAEQLVTSIDDRMLLDDSSGSKDNSQGYIIFRSCIPAKNDEKLSVIGFEGVMLFMLIVSGTTIYFKKFNTAASGAFARIPTSFRF